MLLPETQRRLFTAILRIESDVLYNPRAKELADDIGISIYYFHRSFKSLLGVSFKQYLLRIRLQRAALTLKSSNASVVQIALDSGFDTHAGFTKAFTRHYGQSPTQFREATNTTPYIRYLDSTRDLEALSRHRAAQLVVRIEQTSARTFAAKRVVGTVFGMVKVWTDVMHWAKTNLHLPQPCTCIGVHYDDWDPRIESSYRYDACVELPTGYRPKGVVMLTIPAGPVAMYEFKGSLLQLDRAWWQLVNEWLPTSGYQCRTDFVYDQYSQESLSGNTLQRILANATGIRCTLCIPIEPSLYRPTAPA